MKLITLPDKDRDSSAGFTLLELMVAIAVLAIALVALLSSQSRTMFVADSNDFAATSAQLGSRQFAEILSGDFRSTSPSDNFMPPHEHYFWEVTFGAAPLDRTVLTNEVLGYLQRIDLYVGDERRNQSAVITRYRFAPDAP